MATTTPTAPTTRRVADLDGESVRAWVNGTLTLIGGTVRVRPYAEGLVRVTSTAPMGAGCILPADMEAHREPSGSFTVVA